MRIDLFDNARRLVSARTAAECYGFTPNRAGYICCPFHGERTASLKLYDNGGWYCFGCHAGGSSIDFVSKLLDMSPLDAVRRMNDDFNLALPLDKPPSEAQQRAAQHRRELLKVHQAFEEWRDGFLTQLNAAYRMGHTALQNITSLDDLTTVEALAIQWREALEHWSDCLMCGSLEEQMQIFRERKEIGQLCERILSHMPMKSGVA